MSDGRVEAAEPCRSSSSSSSLSKYQQTKPEESQQQQKQKHPHQHRQQHHHHRDHQQQNQQQQQRKARVKSQTSESLVSAGDASVKSSERRYFVNILYWLIIFLVLLLFLFWPLQQSSSLAIVAKLTECFRKQFYGTTWSTL